MSDGLPRLRHMDVKLQDLEDAHLDHLFTWERDPRAVAMAAFTRADPGDRAAFDEHYQRIRDDPDCTLRAIVCAGAMAGVIGCQGRGEPEPRVDSGSGRGWRSRRCGSARW